MILKNPIYEFYVDISYNYTYTYTYTHDFTIHGCKTINFFWYVTVLNKNGEVPNLSGYEIQAKLCVENLKEALNDCRASLEDVEIEISIIKIIVFLSYKVG